MTEIATKGRITSDNFRDANDLMLLLQDLYEKIESGTISDSTGKILKGVRDSQLKLLGLNIQYMRLFKNRLPKTLPLITDGEDKTANRSHLLLGKMKDLIGEMKEKGIQVPEPVEEFVAKISA